MGRAALCLLLAAVALPAQAQAPAARPAADPTDVIGALLDPTGHADSRDSDEPDTAGQKPARGPDPALAGLPPPSAAPAARPRLTEPVHIEETGKTPDAPPTVRDIAYDSRIRASFAAAQSFQGPLEGGWTMTAPGAGDLYALQLVDRRDRLEGVWRDVRRKGALDASGLVDDIKRADGVVTLRFSPKAGAAEAVAVLRGGADGWTGELTEGAERRPVTLRRSGP